MKFYVEINFTLSSNGKLPKDHAQRDLSTLYNWHAVGNSVKLQRSPILTMD